MTRDIEMGYTGKCENCGKEGVEVRQVEGIGLFKESRGFYTVCFECVGKRFQWVGKDGRIMYSPMDK